MQGYWKDGRYILASTLEDKLDKAQAEIDRLKKRLEPLLEAAKGVLSIVQDSYNSDCRGPGDRCSKLEDAIKEAMEVGE